MHKRHGFTIVELLIVIVVIGILAAISIVAFTGIQDRARATQLISAVDSAEKMIRGYQAQTGEWPLWFDPDGGVFPSVYACLGKASDYPARNGFEAGECLDGGHPDSRAIHSAYLTSELEKVGGGLSVNSSSNVIHADGVRIRGVMYTIVDGEAMILFYLKGNQECGRGEKQTDEDIPDSLTACMLVME